MKFSWRWIRDWVVDETPGEEAAAGLEEAARRDADALTSVGLAVEDVEWVEGDAVFEIDVTTNRPDAMCHRGLARELATRLGAQLRPLAPALPVPGPEPVGGIAIDLREAGSACPRYVARALTGVRVGPSPEWLRRRLEAIGLRSINNVVDVTNYVLWETGQPLHAFDLDRLAEGAAAQAAYRLEVRPARSGERLTTLDGIERRLEPSEVVIASHGRAVALAGLMGGRDTEVTAGTTRVLLESAHFDRAATRRAARRLAMHTDASHRFERGTDPEGCLVAADRACELLIEMAGASLLGEAIDQRAADAPPGRQGTLITGALARFAGFEIEPARIERILEGLGFVLQPMGTLAADSWRVDVPSWRLFDFEADPRTGEVFPADLFEEVLRQVGFDAVPSTLPALVGRDAGSNRGHENRRRAQDLLASAGFAESIQYAFQSAAQDESIVALVDGPAPVLANPLSDAYTVMRRSLLPGLLASARFNLHRGAESVRLFEVGHLFSPAGEIDAVAWVAAGSLGLPWQGRRDLDVFDVKGWVEDLASSWGRTIETRPRPLLGFASGIAAEIWLTGENGEAPRLWGHLGQLAAEGAVSAGLPVFAAEIRLDLLQSTEEPVVRVQVPSRFPSIESDVTLQHALDVPWSSLHARALSGAPAELRSLVMFDRYRGSGVPAGFVNTTLRATYQADDRSLRQDEVNAAHAEMVARLESGLGRRI